MRAQLEFPSSLAGWGPNLYLKNNQMWHFMHPKFGSQVPTCSEGSVTTTMGRSARTPAPPLLWPQTLSDVSSLTQCPEFLYLKQC